jgi:hypothetical protein
VTIKNWGWATSVVSLALGCGTSDKTKAADARDASSSGGTSSSDTGGARSSGGAPNGGVSSTGGVANSGGTDGSGGAPVTPPRADPCVEAGTCPEGVWVDVTPKDADLTHDLDCGNYGTQSMQADPARPGDFYTLFMCQGIWKSTDYGQTWHGPINTGTQGAVVGDCAGGITIPPTGTTSPPTVYASCIRGNGLGFWKSTNGGVDWTRYTVAPGGARQDIYPPVLDPYDDQHLLMAGHEMDLLVESVDGGKTWSTVHIDPGMNENGGTAAIFFIDTGDAATTKTTFLWLAQQSDVYGTWRTSDAGATWSKVDKNEHPHGLSQIYQPDTKGVVYMAGAYSASGWGVERSADYGKTWTHVGSAGNEAVVFGTSRFVYAMNSGAVGLGQSDDPSFELAPQPGDTGFTSPGTPPEMKIGAAQTAIANDGVHNVVLGANWSAGLWRYVEPAAK